MGTYSFASGGSKVTIYESGLISIVQKEGRGFVGDIAKDIERRAKTNVSLGATSRFPGAVRTGRLARSIVAASARGSNQYQVKYRITAYAPYGRYVHEGTGRYGPISPIFTIDIGKKMGPIMVNGKVRYIRTSRGQRPNPFLADAAEAVLARRLR